MGMMPKACNDTAMAILKLYGICRSDIVLSINNTTNMFVTTGRLIADVDDICNMHLANLPCDHAIEKWKMMFNKDIIDSFKKCEHLCLAMCRRIGHMTYSVIDVVLSSRSGERSNEEDGGNNNNQRDGKTSWDHLPKVKDVDNAKELFKSAFVDEATHLFRPPELDTTLNAMPNNDDDNADVEVCDNDDVFGMVKVSLLN
ncbi:unnamed protein product [Sphagnum troendelagicum]|uniref:Uncharacterized protein n=1 Tax=Sphagnum troendelagicum TaxID=128251 RepID=A0ABP0UL82_9BRYO